jgi:hypothetical protein
LAAICLLPARADGADDACSIQTLPPEPPERWQKVCGELARKVPTWPKADRDCRSLLVEITGGGAWVTITTRDGRQAKRLVENPKDLTPVAGALAVSVLAPASEEPPVVDAEVPDRDVPAAAPTRGFASHEALLAVAAGPRWGSPGGFVSPVVRGSAGLAVSNWEVGVFADLAPQHWVIGAIAPPGFRLWSMATGIAVGARRSMPSFDLVAGALLGASFASEKGLEEKLKDGAIETSEHDGQGVDPQGGAYLGLVFPPRSAVRFRAQLELDVPLTHPGTSRELDDDLPSLPGWSLSCVLGAELGVP